MNNHTKNYSLHPVVFLVKTFINKIMQQPDIYPIKFYKKNDRLKKHRRGEME